MRNISFLLALSLPLLSTVRVSAQTAVAVGAGSYASAPPTTVTPAPLANFINTKRIYAAANRLQGPIPTNDWWTDLLVSGKSTGALWSYPMMVDPESYGVKLFYPINFTADGSNIEPGGAMLIRGSGYTPTTAMAMDWHDWGVTMAMPDSATNRNMTVTMVHGSPFTWFETTNGLSPEFGFERGASYLTAAGAPQAFPTNNSFVVRSDGRYFGIHTSGTSSAQIVGQQSVTIDLGSVQPITRVNLNWETAYARGYAVQVSSDNATWNTVYSTTSGDGGIDDLPLSTSGRYVRVALSERGTIYAYSLWEMTVYNGATTLSVGQPVTVTSVEGGFVGANVNDGNTGTRWASDAAAQERLVLFNTAGASSYFVVSALSSPADLTTFEAYAFNKPTNTAVSYAYDVAGGKVSTQWNITTTNLKGQAAGNTIQGFLPHLYANATNAVAFTPTTYATPRGALKLAVGNSFAFTYDFGGVLPSYNSPYRNAADAHAYDASSLYDLLSRFSTKQNYGGDTYWGGKDLVNFAKYTLMAKELNHQAYPALKAKTRAALVNWLTYTPGETEKFFARYDRWGAFVGFAESYGSAEFTDNHFHYGYLTLACALYSMVDPDFLPQYGEMAKLVAKQYANWERTDTRVPYFRTFDPWIGHSYAGGTSSVVGNNQESTGESMQAWIGLFLLGDALQDAEMRAAGAFGYASESAATLEYWFDWKNRNLPPAYPHNVVGILGQQGFAYGTFFSASPVHIHGIQYLPVNPGFSHFARDTAWASREYADLLTEAAADGHPNELDYGQDWANVALGFRQFSDPNYVAGVLEANLRLPRADTSYIMGDETAGLTYFYTHADQNLGFFSTRFRADIPASSVFERNGAFSHAVAYNATSAAQTAHVYDATGATIATFPVPARTLVTYPALPTTGTVPGRCYGLLAARASASTGTATAAIDGNMGTRWESAFADPQRLTVDLGLTSSIYEVRIAWEVANAQKYYLLGSLDSLTWDTIVVRTNMPTGNRTDTLTLPGTNYRYLQMYGTIRNTQYGYSIYEFNVCGAAVGTVLGSPSAAESRKRNALVLLPNPAHTDVRVAGTTATDVVEVLDLTGRLLGRQTGPAPLSVTHLAAGVYLVRRGTSTARLVVE